MSGDDRPFAGLTAVVTGGARNLGTVIASTLAARGATVTITARQVDAGVTATVAGLPTPDGQRHRAIAAELSSLAGAEQLGAELLADGGHVDLLVNNAGPFDLVALRDVDASTLESIWLANVGAPITLARLLTPEMRRRRFGRIVNVSAGSAYVRNHGSYGLAKADLIVVTEALALELGPEITVNAVAPGQLLESADEIGAIDPTFVDRTLAATPTGRLVTRGEVAEVVALLCTPAFASVTGATIPMDGGCRLPRF